RSRDLRALHSFPTRRSSDLCGTGAVLNVTAGTLVNDSGGIISASVGDGGVRTLNAPVDNQGAIRVNQPLGVTNSGRTFKSSQGTDRKSTRLNSSHVAITSAV